MCGMSIVKVREKSQVTIPQDIRKKISCEIGEYVKVDRENNHIVIYPMVMEEKFSEEEVFLLQKTLTNSNNQGKRMEYQEFKEYLKRI